VRRFSAIVFSGALLALLAGALATAASTTDDRMQFAIVGIEARVGGDAVRSSGVVIDADNGLVLTSARAVWGARALRLTTGVGVLHGRIVARAPCADLALLETQPRIPGLVALTGTAADGSPIGRAASGDLVRRRVGVSAPLITADGEIAGIARGGAVLRWPAVERLLDRLQPGERRVYAGWADQYRCTPALHAAVERAHPRFRPIDARLTAPVPTRLPGTQELDR
jgi:hypothetical protein